MSSAFSKILIANRGEIACRVIRTARRLGYHTVAVFSEADRSAPHVPMADEAVCIGPPAAADSYLNVQALLAAARKTQADAVHPGYGFLSENAGFAQACAHAGLVFIGPPAAAIEVMGDKARAKRRMQEAGVPCANGYWGDAQTDAELTTQALQLGFPLLIKALAGGGGRGMRLVSEASQLQAALEGARREALSAFADDRLMLERLIDKGRHIEIQIFADAHGNVVHLGERDCTAQRRRQKVIEESPSPIVSPLLREAMGRDAVAAARAVGYCGAGTVEFMVDAELRHYFLEMNTRLQVEHPVTEMVTGLDLVEWQLRVAAGEPLPLRQEDIRWQGHAMEARLYAEDPYAGFAPQTGAVLYWNPEAALCNGVRVDDGIRQGDVISPYYDPMVAKLVVHGSHRADAIRRLRWALAASPLLGVRHNAQFLSDLLASAAFADAEMTTALIDEWQATHHPLLQRPQVPVDAWFVAAMAFAVRDNVLGAQNWRPNSVAAYSLALRCGDDIRTLRLQTLTGNRFAIAMEGAHAVGEVLSFDQQQLRYVLDDVLRTATAVFQGADLHLAMGSQTLVFVEPSAMAPTDRTQDARRARAPVAGKLTHIAVAVGDVVATGQPMVCVEAMKMEMWLSAQAAATVRAVHAGVGDQVESGALLVELDLVDKET